MDVCGPPYRLCDTGRVMADRSTDLDQASGSSSAGRRAFLAVGALAVAGAAGGGVALGLSGGTTAPAPLQPDVRAALIHAELAEVDLIAGTRQALRDARGAERARLQLVHRDHLAHLDAIRSVVAQAAYPAEPPRLRHPRHAPHRDPAAAESRAARIAAKRALQLTGAPSTLLASIAACEATHAEVLR
jgi:hypothetical protein